MYFHDPYVPSWHVYGQLDCYLFMTETFLPAADKLEGKSEREREISRSTRRSLFSSQEGFII